MHDNDGLYKYSTADQNAFKATAPWSSDPHYFKSVRVSAIALLKMVTHVREGGSIEVMGLMTGYLSHETFVITDSFRLPVEGTETRVSAHAEAYEYMVSFLDSEKESGKPQNAVGWYHSHPGYGCWLSGIDVATERLWQQMSPFVAVVIDPDRTVSAGKVEIGAFVTLPEQAAAGNAATSSATTATHVTNEKNKSAQALQDVPITSALPATTLVSTHAPVEPSLDLSDEKAKDFGAHADQYYPLNVSHFRSTLDIGILEALWSKYWANTLSASPLTTNRESLNRQMLALSKDIVKKNRGIGGKQQHMTLGSAQGSTNSQASQMQGQVINKLVASAENIAAQERTGQLAAKVKEQLFAAGGSGVSVVHGDEPRVDTQMAGQEVQMQT